METYEEIIDNALRYINQARQKPLEFANLVEKNLENYKNFNLYHRQGDVPIITKEGRRPVYELIDFLNEATPIKPLEVSIGLSNAAQLWANQSGNENFIGHYSQDSNSLVERLDLFGKWSDCVTEALDYGSLTGYEVIHSFLVDDGIETREHRLNFFNENFTKIGIGCGPHDSAKTVIVILLAGNFIDNPNMQKNAIPRGKVKSNWEVGNWVDGALRVTCDIATDISEDKLIRTVKRYWEMGDGSTMINEDIIVSNK